MQAYLRAQGQWFIYSTTQPTDGHNDRKDWDDSTERALGNITLHLAPSIQVAVSELTTVKEVWDHLKKNFGTPSIGSAYAELSRLLAMNIPTSSHPAPTITKLLSHFTYLKDTGFEFCPSAGNDYSLQAPSYYGGCSSNTQPDVAGQNQEFEAQWDRQGGHALL